MVFPKFKNKHLEKGFINPTDYTTWTNYIGKDYKQSPKKYIIIYYPSILKYFKKKYKPKRIKLYRLNTIYQYKDIGVVQMTGIGAPNAVTIFEELIALGGKEFLNIGSAGGLKDFGNFLCTKAIRDEGTSYHYISHGEFSYPNKELTKRFEKCFVKNNMQFQKATTWTIDAPYRETKSEIKHYKKQGVKTVEMEASALFAVAKIKKVKIAAAFVVSDVLGGDKWDPQFDSKHVKQNLNKLFDVAVECLLKK